MLLRFWELEAEKRKLKRTINLLVMGALLLMGGRIFAQDTHEYVDLGLPSGTLWATCNVGANAPEEFGDYFAWGETAPKDVYNWSTYQYYDGSNLTKYTGSDGLVTMLPEDDAATANWGDEWRMPAKEEWQELLDNTTNKWTTQNGVNGRLFTGSNGNSLFLPAAGFRWDDDLNYVGSYGYFWSSSLETDHPNDAWLFDLYSDFYGMYSLYRGYGLSVRAVHSASVGDDHAYIDLGLPSGTLWATCNVGANAPEEYGDYFAWGETQPKNVYNWSTYQYYDGGNLTKYTGSDGLVILLPEDDAATANWGDEWRMPTKEEWQELFDYYMLDITWTQQNGVNGRLITAPNGNSLFLPAAGYREDFGFSDVGLYGGYWSSSLDTDIQSEAWLIYFRRNRYGMYYSPRYYGRSVRAVRSVSPSAQLPQVTTSLVTDITTSTATCGGEVVSDGGAAVTERGVCWSTSPNPTVGVNHLSAGAGVGDFSVNITGLEPAITYYVRAYATNAVGTAYGNEVIFTTLFGGDDHAYVDLGLPSGTLWATCNVGANVPEEYGDYFAWGETQPKDVYNWDTYQYCMGSYNTLTKYCNDPNFGYNGFTDNLTTLLPEDDAATANWGDGWRMPTRQEWQELLNNTTVTWTQQNGVNGRLFTALNGNSIFVPVAGYRLNDGLEDVGWYGYYWSSWLYTDSPLLAWYFSFSSNYNNMSGNARICGFSVRAVRSARQN